MITVLWPWWLCLLPPLAVLGYFALWRTQQRSFPVSSTLLWREPSPAPTTTQRPRTRRIDPLWFLLFLAALCAAASLSGLTFHLPPHSQPLPPQIPLDLQMRALPSAPTAELFLRAQLPPFTDPTATSLPTLTLRWGTPHATNMETLGSTTLTPDQLRAGTTLTNLPKHPLLLVEIQNPAQPDVEPTRYSLTQETLPPFGVLTLGPVAPALQRFFTLHPQAKLNDPQVPPRIILANDPNLNLNELPSPAARHHQDAWVILAPQVQNPLPQIPGLLTSPTTQPSNPTATPQLTTTFSTGPNSLGPDLLASVTFNRVHVYQYTPATLPPDWTILATLENHPWLATRYDAPRQLHLLWLASTLTADQTNWPLDPSFVIFFTNLTNTLKSSPNPAPPPSTATDLQTWQTQLLALPHPTDKPFEIPLSSGLAALAALLALLAGIGLALRSW